jgi:hypothetical protein
MIPVRGICQLGYVSGSDVLLLVGGGRPTAGFGSNVRTSVKVGILNWCDQSSLDEKNY